jgi:hypothetical protein
MNLKTFCTGLALSGLGVLCLGTQADAYSFTFLGTTDAGNGKTDYRFGFVTAANEVIKAGQSLIASGFEDISSLSFAEPVNGAGTLYADSVFAIIGGGISNGNKSATFTTKSDISSSNGVIRYQSFVVTAMGVPTGQVDVTFDGNNIGAVAVPEPLTLLGAITAVGFGAAFKRRSLKSVSVA